MPLTFRLAGFSGDQTWLNEINRNRFTIQLEVSCHVFVDSVCVNFGSGMTRINSDVAGLAIMKITKI